MPFISIIINVYNGANTLKETLDSVIAQSYKNWEIIFWDDCSTDNSPEIVKDYPEAGIRYFRSPGNKPSGLGPSRRMAMLEARGEWIAFVDQDDIWLPDKLDLQIALTEVEPDAGFIYGRTIRFFPDGTEVDYDHRHEYKDLPEGNIFEKLFTESCFIAISSVLFRHDAVKSVPPIPDYILVSPDYYLYLKLAKQFPVRAVQQPICKYRMHGGNMTYSSGCRIQNEILHIIQDWEWELDPRLAARRRKIHSTVLATHQLRTTGTFIQGLKTLFFYGSLPYLLSRPLARALRRVRRKIQSPYWLHYESANYAQGN